VLLAALLVLPSACATSRPTAQTEASASNPARQALRRLVDAHFEEQFRRFPMAATSRGLHTYDDQLASFTAEEQLAWADFLKKELAALPQQVERSALAPLDRADYDIFESNLKARILDIEQVRGWERNPNGALGFASGSVFQLINRDFAPLEQRMRSAVARMSRLPEVFAAAKTTLKNPPRLWTEIALQQSAGTRSLFAKTLPEAFAPVKDAALQESFQKEQARVLAALEDYPPRRSWYPPRGRRWRRSASSWWTSTSSPSRARCGRWWRRRRASTGRSPSPA
jgi:hypothetical protein